MGRGQPTRSTTIKRPSTSAKMNLNPMLSPGSTRRATMHVRIAGSQILIRAMRSSSSVPAAPRGPPTVIVGEGCALVQRRAPMNMPLSAS